MPTRAETLAWVIETSAPLVARFFAGFTDANRAVQARHLPNHFVWTLGHVALTMHRLAEKLDGEPIPAADFEVGTLRPPGDPPERFGTEAVCFGSTPTPDAGAYPTTARAREVFDAALARLARAVRHADDDALNRPTSWGKNELPLGDLIVRVIFHNALHAGEIVDLRRALGLGRVVG